MGISSFYRWLWTIGSPASINTTPPLQVCQSLEKMRCQERNPWGSLRETFGKSIQIFTCQQNLKRRNTHVKNTHTHQPCLHNPHHCGHSVFRNVKHVLQQGGKCSSFEMCLFPTKAEREREGEWGSGKKKKKKQAQEILLTRRLLNRCPLLPFPILFPCPWSLNPNGKRSFHVGTRGVLLLSSHVFVSAGTTPPCRDPPSISNTRDHIAQQINLTTH